MFLATVLDDISEREREREERERERACPLAVD
jgi:hypothetical protein